MHLPELAEYIPQIPSETCMVFVEDEVDKRGKLYKAVKSSGRVVEMGRQNEKALMNWVLTALRREKKKYYLIHHGALSHQDGK